MKTNKQPTADCTCSQDGFHVDGAVDTFGCPVHGGTTPERSVEEIVEEFDKSFPDGVYSVHAHQDQGGDYSLTKEVKDWITQTLKAERQRCEEMVEAEKKRTRLAENYIKGEHINEYYTKAEALTQTNN